MDADTTINRLAAALRRRNRLATPSVEPMHPEVRTPATTPALVSAALEKLKAEVKDDKRAAVILVRWTFTLNGDKAKAMVDWLKTKECDLAVQNAHSTIRYQGTYASVIDADDQAVTFTTFWDVMKKSDFNKCGNAQVAHERQKFDAAFAEFKKLAGDRNRSMMASASAIEWPPRL